MKVRLRTLAMVVAVAALASGCAGATPVGVSGSDLPPDAWGPQEPSLNGWPLGAEEQCDQAVVIGGVVQHVVDIASAQAGGHGATRSTQCFGEGLYHNGSETWIVKRSGAVTIVVFSFEDGTRQAVGVYCNVGGCGATQPPRDAVGFPLKAPGS